MKAKAESAEKTVRELEEKKLAKMEGKGGAAANNGAQEFLWLLLVSGVEGTI